MKVAFVLPEHLPHAWPEVEDYMAKATKRSGGRWTYQDVKDDLFYERQHLWVAFADGEKIKGACTTKVLDYPHKRVLNVMFCGGEDLVEWKDDMLETLERFARDQGCTAIEMIGRSGWVRELAGDDWKQTAVVCEKEL